MEGADHRTLRFLDGEQRKYGRKRRMDVHDIVTSPPKHMAHLTPQSEPNGYARLRSVAVDRLTSAKPNDVWLFLRALDVRRDDVDVMSATTGLASEEMHVLADTPEVRIVVLRHQRDAE